MVATKTLTSKPNNQENQNAEAAYQFHIHHSGNLLENLVAGSGTRRRTATKWRLYLGFKIGGLNQSIKSFFCFTKENKSLVKKKKENKAQTLFSA